MMHHANKPGWTCHDEINTRVADLIRLFSSPPTIAAAQATPQRHAAPRTHGISLAVAAKVMCIYVYACIQTCSIKKIQAPLHKGAQVYISQVKQSTRERARRLPVDAHPHVHKHQCIRTHKHARMPMCGRLGDNGSRGTVRCSFQATTD